MTKKKDDTEAHRRNAELQKRVAELEDAIAKRDQAREPLIEKGQFLNSVLDSIQDGVSVSDSDMTIRHVNETMNQWYKEHIPLQGKKCYEVYQGLKEPCDPCPSLRCFTSGETEFDIVPGPPNSPVKWIELYAYPIKNQDTGKVTGVAEFVRDITERERSADALRKSEESLRSVFLASPVGIGVIADRILLQVNPRLCEMTGYSEKELINQSARMLYATDEDFEYVGQEKYEQIRARGIGTVETRLKHKDGHIIDALVSSVPLDRADLSKGITFSVLNITARKRAMDELAEKELYYRTLLNTLHEDILVVDRDYRITDINNTFVQSTGCSRKDAIGRHCFDVTHGYDVPCHENGHECRLMEVFESGEPSTHKQVFRAKDDSPLQVEVLLSPMKDSAGHVTHVIEAVRDITHEVQLEAQMRQIQKLESVGRLAGGVAHDFNNMLNVIIGHTELALEDAGPTHSLFARLQEIHTAAHRSADLTRQLLTFARKQTVSPIVLDINETVAGMLSMLMRLIGEDIDVSWRPGAGVWPVKADPSQINQILANLAVNARDAIENEGKVTIETGTVTFDEAYCADHAEFVPGDFVLLTVSDDGCGMDKDMLDHIFEPFFTTKEVDKGTGMGLSTIYGIVKQNNGVISVYSEPGQGTTFKIYLPRQTGKITPLQKIDPSEQIKGGDETVLLVEDEPTILEMTKVMLERQGYTVLPASTPDEAIRLAGEHKDEIHLLLTDVVMPKMNGRVLARNLLSIRPNLKELFMSGYTANVIAHHGVMDEGIQFLQKPFTMQDLATKVRETLDSTDA